MTDPLCDHLQAYHDGELDAAATASFERHLATCPTCPAELAQWRRLRQVIVTAPLSTPPAEAWTRWRRSRERAEDRRTLRLASWMTAAAAAVLMSASLSLFMGQAQASAPLSVWEAAAVPLTAEAVEADEPTRVMAQWIAADLSAGVNGGATP